MKGKHIINYKMLRDNIGLLQIIRDADCFMQASITVHSGPSQLAELCIGDPFKR